MRVVVAMSGGVDSSVVAALLQEQGHDVIGVHMKLYDASDGAPKPCCGLDDALDARRVADRLGVPFYVMNLRDVFQSTVVDNFTTEYLKGRTPNPCIRCNGFLKFRVLLGRALALGADRLATGHYARIGPGPSLLAARDGGKDQSYFLYSIEAPALDRVLFPLGDMTKGEVREQARRLGLVTAEKPESQEVCFIPDDDHARFVREARPSVDGSGEIVDESGRVLGCHDGYFRFTVGQRRGLNVALGKPAYVLRIDAERRQVVVGADERLHEHAVVVSGCNWFTRPSPEEVVAVRIRHRGAHVPCRAGSGDPCVVTLLEPTRAVCPGQAAVFYNGERVLGGGTIDQAVPE